MSAVTRRRRKDSASNGRQPTKALSVPASYVDRLGWSDVSEDAGRSILSGLTVVDDAARLAALVVHARVASLPFYEHWKLVRIEIGQRGVAHERATETVYALWQEGGEPRLLDGQSDPIHAVNAAESLHLDPKQAADYIRFFFFALRAGDGDGDAFILFEEAPKHVPTEMREAAADAQPLTPAGTDPEGRMLFDATVIFQGNAFKSRLAVPPDGSIEMVDDDPLKPDFPTALVAPAPWLGAGPLFSSLLDGHKPQGPPAAVRHGRRPRRTGSAKSSERERSTLVELVRLLLENALLEQAQNRLLGYFNATQPGSNALEPFAKLMRSSSPVLVVESAIPFVEETIAEVINDLLPAGTEMALYRGSVSQDYMGQEILDGYTLPDDGPAIVLVPFLVYRRVAQVERLAFYLATHDLAAIITCERFDDLPEGLRRHTDLVLRLPRLDEKAFAALFQRVIGRALPRRWRAGGTQWVKNTLHTDFEHPRRTRLPAQDAFAFVHAQVAERLRAVDPVKGMSLKDLHGMGEGRQFAQDLIADIHAAIKGQLAWSQVDRGALLVGPPGTGKTTLAMAIAKDCDVKFIHGSAATWMAEGGSLGPHIQAIRRTFSEARNYAPSILFIDEIDSLGSREQFSRDNNSVYQTEVVNAVLEQMQGMDPTAPVVVIGATNNEGAVDPALLRSGRLDRVIRIPRPNSEALDHIYRYHLGQLGVGVAVGRDVNSRMLGKLSVGLTGADVERIVRGAARRGRKGRRAISQVDLTDELTNKPRGTDIGQHMTEAELERTAVHEAGHALAAYLSATKGTDIGFVSIIPREDGTLGFVAALPDERALRTRREYQESLEVYLAGRAAEEITYGTDEISGGASSDLMSATAVATTMVTKLGLSGNGKLLWTETVSTADQQQAEDILRLAYDRVLRNLKKNQRKLQALAAALVARQELAGQDISAIVRGRAVGKSS